MGSLPKIMWSLLFCLSITRTKAEFTRDMYDSISFLVTGSPYPDIWWEEREACLSRLSPNLMPALELGWAGMVEYWTSRGGEGDTWAECRDFNSLMASSPALRSGWFESNCTTQPGIEMDIWEPCNYASNLAYDRLVLELCTQDDWTFPQHTVDKITETFALVTFGSSFCHGSATRLGGLEDVVSNNLFVYILYQAGVSSLPYSPIIHDLAHQPRNRSGEEIVDFWMEILLTRHVSEWYHIMDTEVDLPPIQYTFCGVFGYIFTLVLDPEVVDSIMEPLMDAFGGNHGFSEEDKIFFLEEYLPVLRNTTYGTWLGLGDRISLATNTLATVAKLLTAFFWQEDVFDLGGLNLSPEANEMGAQMLPVINELANNYTSWDLKVEDVQQGEGYPGSEWCNNIIPHAKWHVQTAASLADISLLMDQVFRLVEENKPSQ